MHKHYYFNNSMDNHFRHEVHTDDCKYLPSTSNRTYIGYENSCNEAIARAKKANPGKSFDGCYWCCRPCHKG